MPNNKTPPRRVDFLAEPADFKVALLGALGKSTLCIVGATKLTPCQVSYRLAKARIKRTDYRNGTGDYDRLIYNSVEEDLTKVLRRELERQFKRR